MKPMTLALVAAVALAGGTVQAQTATQSPAATPPAAASETGKKHLSHECKEEVKKACGRAHGDEMHKCVKSSLDLNKFSDACKMELSKSEKPGE